MAALGQNAGLQFESMDLSHNRIGPPGGAAFAELLTATRSLHTLNVAANKLSDVGISDMAAVRRGH
jgi:hypothetical protein